MGNLEHQLGIENVDFLKLAGQINENVQLLARVCPLFPSKVIVLVEKDGIVLHTATSVQKSDGKVQVETNHNGIFKLNGTVQSLADTLVSYNADVDTPRFSWEDKERLSPIGVLPVKPNQIKPENPSGKENGDEESSVALVICSTRILRQLVGDEQSTLWVDQDHYKVIGRPAGPLEIFISRDIQLSESNSGQDFDIT